MRFTSPGKARFTSRRRRDVTKRKNQEMARRKREGRNPPNEEMTGSASMPAPVAVPVTSKMPPTRRLVRNINVL